ncbi:MAG: apolipoprotein N-acyltransferase [Sulfitobacter sp.]
MSSRWLRAAVPVVFGAAAALGQAPFEWPVLFLLALAGMFVWLRRSALTTAEVARRGWAFGFGYFAISLHWIVSPFLVDAARHGWMAPFAVVLMAAGGALFWMAGFWLARRMGPRLGWLVVTLPVIELFRSYIFTGFPWASPAQTTVNTVLGQGLSLVGPQGVNLVLIALAVMIAVLLMRRVWWGRALAAVLVLPVLLPSFAKPATRTGQVIRLVQPNAPQHQKWDPEMIPIFYARQLEFTAAPPSAGLDAPALIVWPETAIPWTLSYAGDVLPQISAAAGGTPVVLGVQRNEGERFYNSLVTLGPQGTVEQMYDKHHLVPFGEYVPLGDFMARFGIYGLAPQYGSGFSAGPGAQLMDFGALGRALPLICYEAVFAHDVNAAPARPDFIIHATNDAWFGKDAGPQQHLAQARMRAIEQGLPVARAANTGISAMIDPHGRVLDHLGLGQAGYVDAVLPAPLAPTLYSRTGDWPVTVLLLLALAVGLLRSVMRHRTPTE